MSSSRRELLTRERGAGKCVVLAVDEHVSADHGELARDGDGGDVRATTRTDALVRCAHRPGAARQVPGRLNEHVARLARPLLGDTPMAGGFVPRLRHARVEPQIPDKV